ncbi:alpha-2-macroglobulin-like protein 1 [Heterodontus francisci]|uniref:alpha-2-macroglobulin-like protein 1 n=1 Tax=Heterodontus francisci TaxID=7792 RepID=UPI00355C9B9B
MNCRNLEEFGNVSIWSSWEIGTGGDSQSRRTAGIFLYTEQNTAINYSKSHKESPRRPEGPNLMSIHCCQSKTYKAILTVYRKIPGSSATLRVTAWSRSPRMTKWEDIAKLLQDMGLKILTDTGYHRPIECQIQEDIAMGTAGFTTSARFGFAQPVRLLHAPLLPSRLAVPVREFFPETWIWDLVPVGSTGSISLPITVPDSITEWKGSMFCTGQAGFGISDTVSLNAFKPFFVDLALPYSVIRTEGFTLKAKVFNYMKQCIMVKITLLEAQGFNVTSDSRTAQETCICSKDSVTFSWNLTATELGEQNLTVQAESISSESLCGNEVITVPVKGAVDVLRKPLLVRPEGTETELTHSSFLCPAGKMITEKIHLQVPGDVVEGSSRAYITVLGDILGSAMENLDSLLRLPTGCGEQNMVKFAPNVYVLRYLTKTHQITGGIQNKVLGFLRTGYQNQLTFKHEDGSYSAFGTRDPEGNTW